MNFLRTSLSRFLVVALALGVVLVWSADPADAHPLGNFSVNQLEAITFRADRVDVAATVDTAELPTLQEKSAVDRDGNGTASPSELAAFAASSCDGLADGFAVRVGGAAVPWSVSSSSFAYVPGSAGLSTSRLTCALTGPASLGSAVSVDVRNAYRTDHVGWREITAVGDGVGLVDSPLPVSDVSDGLRAYPADLLSSPPDVRSASFSVRPGASSGSSVEVPAVTDGSFVARWTASADAVLRSYVGRESLTPTVGLLAVLLALALGAGHAALPGHGKTVMAAYLAGRRGRRRDAVVVGATVTATHTGGVLLLGLVLTTVAGLVGEMVLGYLGVVSGLLVAAVGIGMLREAHRRRTHSHSHDHGSAGEEHEHAPQREPALVGAAHPHAAEHATHTHAAHDHAGATAHVHETEIEHVHTHETDHSHSHSHEAGHSRGHGEGHTHSHSFFGGHSHGHGHSHGDAKPSRLGLIGIGIAGGLVPSPSALVILLGAIGLGRTWFGVLLVIGYGLGMAGALTAAGLALIVLQERVTRWRRWERIPHLAARWSAAAPLATAGLVLVVGLGLAGRSLLAV
ncbi:High-affinity nickel-transporter [Cryptosporangium sp. NPDC048952]|uniref:High-affinity nickel-transporter n=1 Tax=Cryptosporangium sp. NPDC048952 TaxID=3363961 RepID=UPI00371B0A09